MIESKKEEQKSEYLNITEDGGMKKKIIREGLNASPENGNEVVINYFIENSDDQMPDKTYIPFTFKIGSDQIIKGLNIGVKTMKIGEKSRFILSPDYTTGIEKVFDISPKKSSLIVEIELLKIIEPIKKISDMTYEEKLLEAKKLKIKGVEKFKIKDIAAARDLFERSATYLESIEKIKEVEAEGVIYMQLFCQIFVFVIIN